MTDKERETFVIKQQEKFEADVVLSTKDFLIFTWSDPSTGNLSTKYYLDKIRGTLIISGDSGDCIAKWYSRASAKDIYSYLNDEWYFIEKIKCSSSLYTYKDEDIVEDLDDLCNDMIKTAKDCEWSSHELWDHLKHIDVYTSTNNTVEEMVLDAFGWIRDYILYECESPEARSNYPNTICEILNFFGIEATDLCDLGKRVSPRITLWRTGYRLAYEQLQNTI